MAITPYSGIILPNGTITSGTAAGAAHTGGTLVQDQIVYDWSETGHTANMYYVVNGTTHVGRVYNDIVVGDHLFGSSDTFTSVNKTKSGYLYVTTTGGSKYIFRHVVTTGAPLISYFCAIVTTLLQYDNLFNAIGNVYSPKQFVGPLSYMDFISYNVAAGKYVNVHYWNDNSPQYVDTLNDDGTNFVNLGWWYGYQFNSKAEADDDLISIPTPIITIGILPGPIIVIITPGGTIVTDDGGTVLSDGSIAITGDIYTGGDIPTDIPGIADPITTSVGDTDSLGNPWEAYPKVWRARTTTNIPNNTEGHNNLYNMQGIKMLELGAWRMRDLFKYAVTTNPMTRDVR